SGTCVSVRLVGTVSQIDQLEVDVSAGGNLILRGNSTLQNPLVTLPVQFAVRFATPIRGIVTLDVFGRRAGSTVARGNGSVTIPSSGQASLQLTMFPTSDFDFAVPPDLYDSDGADLRGVDLASGVLLSPELLELGSVTVGQRTVQSFFLQN